MFKTAQESWQAKGGLGRRAIKNMMPRDRHVEILQSAGLVGQQASIWTVRVDSGKIQESSYKAGCRILAI